MNIFYYDTEKNIYLTQLDAVAAKKTGKNIFFYYYDKEFSQIDWTIEPLEPLEQLYKERAQKIRDEKKFQTVNELIAQIKMDVDLAESLFKKQ